jgi:Mg-chelatase subunit ChlD
MLINKSNQKLSEQLSYKQVQELVVQLVKKTREHPEIKRGASVRASLAVMEMTRGYSCLRKKLTRKELKDAAMLSLPGKITVCPESRKKPEEIVLEIVQEVILEIQSLEYGDPFKKEKPPSGKDPDAEFTKELMDFQEQQYKGNTRLKNLHAELVRRKGKGENVEPESLDYNLLEKKMKDLEAEGIVKLDEIGDGYQLQAPAIIILLKNILKKDLSKTVKNTRKETVAEKSSIRKYMKSDTYRMMSPRHTLRRMIRKGKRIDEISVDDIRCFEKVSITGKDIAVCMDVSESMKEGLKLCYAKLAAAAVAKTAAADKNRVCIVSFSNTAETVCPLSADLYRISQALLNVQTGKYTNAADAVKTARSLLQKGNATNQKQIIMISDGLPNISSEEELYFQTGDEEMENFGISFGAQSSNQHFHSEVKTEMHTMFKNLNASNAAYKEVKKSRKKDIETSFLYIGGDDERGITFAKKVARLGNGTFYHVKDITALPNKAFQMGCV